MADKSYKAELVGVYGCPVAENPTVIMEEAGFKSLNLNYRYLTMEVKPEDLKAAMESLKVLNMKGINLTIPHKVEVLKYLDSVAADAEIIGAVNTVYVKDGKLYGENTDGKGFMISLKEDGGLEAKGKKVVIFGAGGAARAITVELALAGASHIIVINRNEERGLALVKLLNDKTPVKAEFAVWDHIFKVPEDADIVINSTSIGLYPNIDEKPEIDYSTLKNHMLVCDVIPNPPQTAFLNEAQKYGVKTIDGLGMLVNQGAIGFKIWTGKDAPVNVMKEALKKEFEV
ncbi:MAG: aroE [Clostridia bacterium]|jgi:shikimate dehydrogenase|nr:aroE [Clostridia bacterium]